MNNCCDLMFLKNLIKGGAILYVDFIERRPLAGDFRNTFQNRGPAVCEVIYNNRMIACGSEGDNGMAPNVAGSTGNENNFFCIV